MTRMTKAQMKERIGWLEAAIDALAASHKDLAYEARDTAMAPHEWDRAICEQVEAYRFGGPAPAEAMPEAMHFIRAAEKGLKS